jgi:uncharacterized protein (DUF2252 family)
MKIRRGAVRVQDRAELLRALQNSKMARSAHAYVRGNAVQFYEWLEVKHGWAIPQGPAIWICGDCHLGNLGPLADDEGLVQVQIRDLDQTVIGNPAHDLIRLALSLATAARGSDLPGITTVRMIEALMVGYESAFPETDEPTPEKPQAVTLVMKKALERTWKHLARERIDGVEPTIPLGKRFWQLDGGERKAIDALFSMPALSELVTQLKSRPDDAHIKVVDAAYWRKGCSSLGRLRYAVLLEVNGDAEKGGDLCLIDIKEATRAAAPHAPRMVMPRDHAKRVVEGARHLSPALGNRMRAATLLDRPVFIRELLPQDLKLEIEQMGRSEALKVARFLAMVMGHAHSRQMDSATRRGWRKELQRNRSKSLDAPSWLWSSVLDLMGEHERGYLEHCRKYVLQGEH